MRNHRPNVRSTLILIISAFLAIAFLIHTFSSPSGSSSASSTVLPTDLRQPSSAVLPPSYLLTGPAIASKLGNETLKAELGRAAWKVFHTTFASFPDRPSDDESAALKSYVHLFQRLYPCGECATHFGEILTRFPPQVDGRQNAAAWGCHVHNEVNKSLGKDIFDCSKIGDFYDCGCADDEDEKSSGRKTKKNMADDDDRPLKMVKVGLTAG